MHDVFSEFRSNFIEESEEHLALLNEDLITLEKDPQNRKRIDSIFRVMHTLKSSAAAVGYNDLSRFAHAAEDLIQNLKDEKKSISAEIIDILFIAFDRITVFLNAAKQNTESKVTFHDLLDQIENVAPHARSKSEADIEKSIIQEIQIPDTVYKAVEKALKSKQKIYRIYVEIDPAEPIKWLRAELLLSHLSKLGEIIHLDPEKASFHTDRFTGKFTLVLHSRLTKTSIQKSANIDLIKHLDIRLIKSMDDLNKEENVRSGGEQLTEVTELQGTDSQRPTSVNSIRVPVKKLDDLMHMVGELVVTNSGFKMLESKIRKTLDDDLYGQELNQLIDKLMKISSGIQRSVLKTRMLPLQTQFSQFKRVVRDLAKKENKEIELIIKGAETELDKKVIDVIGDPLTHLVRNAIDHGMELPDERKRLNKASQGRIELSAAQIGNHIVITVKDDGRGIDVEKVKQMAIQKDLLDEAMADSTSKVEMLNLLFEPGFSTAEKVSSVSGRGVGLDVVNNVINSLNGSVTIESELNHGTEFIITLPLTLAISSVIVVESNKNLYGISITDIRESIKVPIEDLQGRDCFKAIQHDGKVIPVVGLHDILDDPSDRVSVDAHGEVSIVIVSYREKEIGLIVDRIIGKQEIVLKSLEENYKSVRGISGAAILGDGTIILVMDIIGVIHILKEIEIKDAL
ncbi:chemotaxis protein CheA [candidate division KSB1 bacterium]|nr:chemotaxis protein CheA [candidate division KSB1 bacterium]